MAQSVIGALRVTLGMDSAAFSKGLKGAESKLSRFGKMASRGLLAVGAAATAAAAGLALSVRGTLNAADEMAKASRKIGIPIEDLARLKHAADLSGVSFEGLQNAVKRLSANMNDAKNGVGEAKDAFEQLGVSVTNSDGSLKSASQMLTELSAVFATMPDGAEKTALAMDLMGKSGADMIPLLNGGAEALKSMMAEADSLGLVFTEEMATNAERFNDNMNRLGKTFGAIGRQLAAELAPHLAEFTDWLVANAPRIVEFTMSMVEFGISAVKAFADIGAAITNAWQAFENWWNGLLQWREQVFATVREVADGILLAFQELPAQMVQIGADIMRGLLDGLISMRNEVTGYFTGLGEQFLQNIKDVLAIKSPSRVMMEVGENVMKGLSNGMEGMRGNVMNVASSISSNLANAFTGIITGAQTVEDALKNILSQMANMALNQTFNTLLSGLLGGGGGAGGGILGGLFGGFFADGGRLGAGKWGIAGEAGPEVIHGPAQVTPIDQMMRAANSNDARAGIAQTRAVIDVGVSVDDDGQLQGYVKKVSEQTLGRAAPAIVRTAVDQASAAAPTAVARANYAGGGEYRR